MQRVSWVIWNISLACIPVVLAYLLAWGIERYTVKRKKVPWLAWTPLVIAWFAFVPNSCYLLTEWRHFLFDPYFIVKRETVTRNSLSQIEVAQQGMLFLLYSAVGGLCFALSIRPIEHLLRRARVSVVLCAVPFFLLVSLGVYMGLIVRLNTWDILRRPEAVVSTALHALFSMTLLKVVILFAFFLWVLYILVDIWVDGFMGRLNPPTNADAGK